MGWRRAASWVLALALLGAHTGVLAWVRRRAAPGLQVVLASSRGSSVRVLGASRMTQLRVDGRLRASLSDLMAPAGLHQARWERRYPGRAPRAVAHTYLIRPTPRVLTDGWSLRAAGVHIAQERLDGPRGDDLASALEPAATRAVRWQLRQLGWLQRKAADVLLGALADVRINLRIVANGLELAATVRFEHDGQKLVVAVRAPLLLELRKHRLVVRRGACRTHIATRTRPGWWRRLRAFVAERVLEHYLPERVDTAFLSLLPRLESTLAELLSRRLAIARLDPPLELELRLAALDLEPGRRLALTFDVRLHGPTGGPVASLAAAGRRPSVGSAALGAWLGQDALNALLATYWRTGTWDVLAAAGAGRLRAALDPRLARLLAFRVQSAQLRQPPMLMGSGALVLGPLRLGLEPLADPALPRFVDLHARLHATLTLDSARRQVMLRLGVRALSSSCGEGTPQAPLRACFSELTGLGAGWLDRHRTLDFRLGLSEAWRRFDVHLGPVGRLELRPRLEHGELADGGIRLAGRMSFGFRGRD